MNTYRQAQKLNIARLSFNTIIMYGIAGEGRSVENALATAEMINQFKSDRIVTMNLTLFAGTPLYEMAMREEFFPASDQEKLIEIKTLLENLDPQENTIFDTNYVTNIIKMTGTLPYDRRKLINKVSRFIRE